MKNFESRLEKYNVLLVGLNFSLTSLFFIILFRLANEQLQPKTFGVILLAISLCSVLRIFDGGLYVAVTNWVAKSSAPSSIIRAIFNAYTCLLIIYLPVYCFAISWLGVFAGLDDVVCIALGFFMLTSTLATLIQIILDALHVPLIRLLVGCFSTCIGISFLLFLHVDAIGYVGIQIIFHSIVIITGVMLIKTLVPGVNLFSVSFPQLLKTIRLSWPFQITNISSFSLDPLTKAVVSSIDTSFVVAYEAANQIFGKVKLLVLSYLNLKAPAIAKSRKNSLVGLFKSVQRDTYKLIIIGGLPFVFFFPVGFNFLMVRPGDEMLIPLVIVASFYYLSFFSLPFHIYFVARLKAIPMVLVQIPLFATLVVLYFVTFESLYFCLGAISLSYVGSGLYHVYLWRKL
jgi:hypothetical protein